VTIPNSTATQLHTQAAVATTTPDIANWVEVEWESVRPPYPPAWKAEDILYRTPPQQERGDPPTRIGVTTYPAGSSTDDASSIHLGGRQVDCMSLGERGVSRCIALPAGPLYTFSQDPEILAVFDIIATTVVVAR
jgi:hypothetical protein